MTADNAYGRAPTFTVADVRNAAAGRSYARGLEYFRGGHVSDLVRTGDGPSCRATVLGQRECEGFLRQDGDGALDGDCDCPAFEDMGMWCKHLVAVALTVLAPDGGDMAPRQPLPGPRRDALAQAAPRARAQAREFPSLFRDPIHVAGPETVLVEFTLLAPRPMWGDSLGLATRMGPKRLYVAQRVRRLLATVARGERHEFTANFAYEPEHHGFRPEDAAVLAALAPLADDVGSGTPRGLRTGVHGHYGTSPDRTLMLPPEAASGLLPLLETAGALLGVVGGREAAVPLRVQDPPLPLHAAGEAHEDGGYVNEGSGRASADVDGDLLRLAE